VVCRLALGAALLNCAQQSYVLPVPDGVREPSPPSLQGHIRQVGNREIVVIPSETIGRPTQSVTVRIVENTQLFTVYGGYVSVSDLAEGQAVRVWLDKSGLPEHGQAMVAAVIMLASKDPKNGWPKGAAQHAH